MREKSILSLLMWLIITSAGVFAQAPRSGEIRQIVTFSFLPGKSAEALEIYQSQAIPLYEKDEAMLSFRAFREVESPVPLDLMVVSAFDGMAGMDASNMALRALATEAGTSILSIYGGIAALSSGHTDQFVEMLPELGTGDPSSKRLTAFIWYQLSPGQRDVFEQRTKYLVSIEKEIAVPSATGRFLVSDGWHYLRMLSFDSLGAYQSYWSRMQSEPRGIEIDNLTVRRREVIVASVPAMSVR